MPMREKSYSIENAYKVPLDGIGFPFVPSLLVEFRKRLDDDIIEHLWIRYTKTVRIGHTVNCMESSYPDHYLEGQRKIPQF